MEKIKIVTFEIEDGNAKGILEVGTLFVPFTIHTNLPPFQMWMNPETGQREQVPLVNVTLNKEDFDIQELMDRYVRVRKEQKDDLVNERVQEIKTLYKERFSILYEIAKQTGGTFKPTEEELIKDVQKNHRCGSRSYICPHVEFVKGKGDDKETFQITVDQWGRSEYIILRSNRRGQIKKAVSIDPIIKAFKKAIK